jgi:PAS domain S-box-containing protein
MTGFLSWLLNTSTFEPHGICLLWRPDLVWTMATADGIVAAAYFSIPAALVFFAVRRKDLAFPWVFFLFGVFILLCGGSHVMEAITLWVPAYGMEAAVKAATAVASLATAVALWPLMPKALALPGFGDLHRLNGKLEREVVERRRAEAALHDVNAELERRVAERTAALTRLTDELQAQIAERQRVDEGLRESTDLLQATLDAAAFPISVAAPDTTVLTWNKAAERDFGYTAEEMIGRRYRDIVPQSDLEEFEALFRRAVAGEQLRGVEVRRRHRSGRLLDIRFSSAPVRDRGGRVRTIVYVLEDVTQRNAVEAQLRQAQKMEAIGNLTGGMAHDFNNLLGVIIGNLDLLRPKVASDPENHELAGDALDAALRGADLTRRLLAFARRQPLRPERIELNVLVERSTALLRRMLGENIEFRVEFDPEPWPTLVDPPQLEAAIANLATNARDAMPKGGKLIIRTAKAHLDAHYAEQHPEVAIGDYAVVEICDTGVGVPPEILGRIFEPFFTTKEEGKGSGLGLAMVFGFVKQSGGHISVYSEVGEGSCFRIYLPRAGEIAAAAAPPAREQPPSGRESVLVVEDNEKLRRVVVRQIAGLGYRLFEAEDAAAALAILRGREHIDLLFTDIVMPGEMSGSELANAATSLVPGIKVLFTSGFPEARAESSGWIGSDARLLAKPYRKEELARALRLALES